MCYEQVGMEDQRQTPAVHGRSLKPSYSLKPEAQAAWDNIMKEQRPVTSPQLAGAASPAFGPVKSPAQAVKSPAGPVKPVKSPGKTASFRRTVSKLGGRLAPASWSG